MPEAATPTGGAEASARPANGASQANQGQPSQQLERNGAGQFQSRPEPQTVAERMKAAMFEEAPKVAPKIQEVEAGEAPEAPVDNEQQAGDEKVEGQPTDESQTEGAQEEAAIASLSELAEGLGWDLDKVLDLEASTKIDGKEGKAKLRDLLKSYQLEGHLNQNLMRLAEDRKAFEAETGRKVSEVQALVQQVNQAAQLAQKILDGEFADVNWQELQRTDPAAFQAKYGAYQMRMDAIRQLNQVGAQEQERVKAQHEAAAKAYLAEQAKLLDSKLPEWADAGKREKDVTEMVATLNEAYGLTEQEVRSTTDHRLILLARDAAKWQKLQKSKPTTLQKVRAAPKLIRPGTQQSRSAQNEAQSQQARLQLRRSGKVQDATNALKGVLFSN